MKYYWDSIMMTFERQSQSLPLSVSWYSHIHLKWYPYHERWNPSYGLPVPDLALILQGVEL